MREILYRAGQVFVSRILKYTSARGISLLATPSVDMASIGDLLLPSFQIQPDIGLISQILKGKRFCLNGGENEDDIDSTGSADSAKDIRMFWEPARLQHLTYLLASISERMDAASASFVKQSAVSMALEWLEGNPFPLGPHYMSAMECGLRIPVFFYCLKAVDDPRSPAVEALLDAIYRHAWWVEKRLSLYSSLGNHTICECVGLVFAGAVFRNTKEGGRWLSRGLKTLRQEIHHQVLEDGGPAEQSIGYHRFVLDLYWLTVDFLERNAIAECVDLKARLRRGERFLAAFEDFGGSLPSIGDSDDGHAIAPRVYPKRG
ncbi:MAG: heparinase II/III family protein [Syntrophobacteraceae bacterium]